MEESKIQTHRRSPGGSGRPVRRASGAQSAASSHVIDLRTAKPAPSSSGPMPLPPPGSGRRRPPKPARRPLAAPSQAAAPVADRPTRAVKPKPLPVPPAAVPAISPSATEPSLPPRRFWPAFWRFLLLLIILGFLVTGGLYLYVNYYRG